MKTRFLYAFCAFVFCCISGCKKDNSQKIETSQNADQFFSVPAYVPQIVKNIAEVIRRDDNNFSYIDDLTQKEGYALWDKSIVKIDRNGDSTVTIPLVKKRRKIYILFFPCKSDKLKRFDKSYKRARVRKIWLWAVGRLFKC
ncbi:hypothetical protein [Pinibacter aurantiacus]|uniref:Uncharacterized protein n=1 Tax=Pinibacter aurantiacus TaxID=2851599 RepID=A0A9E2W1Q0_9BACT|nr:hypothetical protein [Pinibacter aurantiacus]MBV4356355.1 hypothetical protein [Pinibacter aurantiacus]